MEQQSLKIITIFGTRPEVIKLFPVLHRLEESKDFNSIIVSTSQHREMIEDLIDLFSLDVDHDLNIMRENQTLVDISSKALIGLSPIIEHHCPDLVLVQGDTTTAFIGALAAFYHSIPVGHVEAGLRSFDKMHPYPEEVNRRLISTVSELHFAPTLQNADNLYKENIDTSKVFVTGNTVIDSLLHVSRTNHQTLSRYLPIEARNTHRMILVTAHRRENWGRPLEKLCYGLRDLAESHSDIEIIYPVHMNPNVRKTAFEILADKERIHLVDPLPYEPFVEAMARSYMIITDSGGIQEEGPSLQKPILVFRKTTERPEGVATGGVKLIGLERESVVREASHILNDPEYYRSMIADGNPYGDGQASERIIQAIRHNFWGEDRPADFVYGQRAEGQRIEDR